MAKKAATAGSFKVGNKAAAGQMPRGRFITQRLIAMMHEEAKIPAHLVEEPSEKGKKTQRLVLFCRMLFKLALEGDMQALKYIGDRIEGTAIQAMTFVPQDEADEQALNFARLSKVHEQIKDKSVDELAALYAETLRAGTTTHGSA